MKQFSVAVDKIEDGILHVRSAGLIMKEASQFASDVKVTKDEKTALEEMQKSDNFKGDTTTKQTIFQKFRSYFS